MNIAYNILDPGEITNATSPIQACPGFRSSCDFFTRIEIGGYILWTRLLFRSSVGFTRLSNYLGISSMLPVGACQHSLKKLSITPELLSLNIQKSSLTAAEAQYVLESGEVPRDFALEQANVKKEMVFINCTTKSLQKSNATSEVLVLNLREELENANEEYRSMKSVMDEKGKHAPEYFTMKQDEYVKRAMIIKERLLGSGIPAFGLYKSIIDYSNNVSRSEAQLAKLSDMLMKYGNLPPDIQGAKIKLIEAKAKLEELNQRLQQKIVADI